MNKRHLLLGLLVFASVTTLTMIFFSDNMAVLQLKASRMFGRRGNASRLSSSAAPSTPSRHPDSGARPTDTAVPVRAAQATNRPLRCQHCFVTALSNLTAMPEVCAGSSGGNGSGNGSGGGSGNGSAPEMVMLITTSLDGAERRRAIRETWVTATRNNTAHVRHVFLLGTDRQGGVSEELRVESARYRDILVSDFVDVYANLTLKTMAGLHYLVEHCGQAKFFLKTDHDMYIFVEHVLELARKNSRTLQTSLGGSCHQTGKPWRDPKTKYYASVRSYPQSTYPGFCSGTGYVSSLGVARKIVAVSPDVPFFHLEDVYLALVLRHVGFKLTRYPGFLEGSGVCQAPAKARSAMTIHDLSPQKIRELWAKKCGVA